MQLKIQSIIAQIIITLCLLWSCRIPAKLCNSSCKSVKRSHRSQNQYIFRLKVDSNSVLLGIDYLSTNWHSTIWWFRPKKKRNFFEVQNIEQVLVIYFTNKYFKSNFSIFSFDKNIEMSAVEFYSVWTVGEILIGTLMGNRTCVFFVF